MAKTIKCERCQKKYKFVETLAGKTVLCPNCQLPMRIPMQRWVEPAIEGIPPVPPQTPEECTADDRPVFHEAPPPKFLDVVKEAWPEYRELWTAGAVFMLSVIGWLLTPKALLFEAILVSGVVFGLVGMCLQVAKDKVAGWKHKLWVRRFHAAACCTAGLLYFFTATDNDVRRFNDGIYDNRVEHVTRRWNRQWVRGSHRLQRDGSYEHGPLTQSGKSHGEWTVVHSVDGKVNVLTFWYWYGDQISEGEWALRNKQF